jgi:hypothetical protein
MGEREKMREERKKWGPAKSIPSRLPIRESVPYV